MNSDQKRSVSGAKLGRAGRRSLRITPEGKALTGRSYDEELSCGMAKTGGEEKIPHTLGTKKVKKRSIRESRVETNSGSTKGNAVLHAGTANTEGA